MKTTAVYTVGDLARMFDCPEWAVRRLFTRGLIREPARLGPYRLIPDEQLGAVEQALRAAGYVRHRTARRVVPAPPKPAAS